MRPLVMIPTYNERAHVQRLVPRLLEIPQLRVLVVDDMSPDGTGFAAEVLSEHSDGRVSVVHRIGRPRGLGRASLDGLRLALATDADVICQIDARISPEPEVLESMLDAVRHVDLVIGTRFGRGLVRNCTSSVRCWRRDALAALALDRIHSEGSAALVHMLYEALANGCTVSEVAITLVERPRHETPRPRFLAELVALPWALSAAASAPPAALRAADSGPR